jgi:hypothetical protein
MTNSYNVPLSKFALGKIVITSAADEKVPPLDVSKAVMRHSLGDWGDVSAEDRDRNESALWEAGRLHSVHHARNGLVFWIITEADRSVTTVLLPDDY